MKYSVIFPLFMIILGATALAPTIAKGDLVYVAVDPCRIVDTRLAGGVITANNFRNFRISGTRGELAVQGGNSDCLHPKAGTGQKPLAIVAYVLAVPPGPGSGSGVLTAYPSNQLPPPAGSGSTVNFSAQQVIGNTTTITLCDPAGSCPTNGEFAILSRNTFRHVVIDVQGYFYPQVLDFTGGVLSIPAGALMPRNHTTPYDTNGVRMDTSAFTLATFVAPIFLPQGVVIRHATLEAHDNNGGEFGGYVRAHINEYRFNTFLPIADFDTVKEAAPGDTRVTVNNVNHPIDNSEFSYGITVEINNPTSNPANERFFKMIIDYD